MRLTKIKQQLNTVLEPFLLVLLTSLVLVVLWQVFSRYVLQSPSTSTDEIARFQLIWLALIGAAWVVGQKAHLAIDILPDKFMSRGDMRLHRLLYLLIFIFAFVVMIIGGLNLVQVTLTLKQYSTALQIPMGYIYLAIPLSGLLMSIYAICHIFEDHQLTEQEG